MYTYPIVANVELIFTIARLLKSCKVVKLLIFEEVDEALSGFLYDNLGE